jgi:hypothetical protein
LRRFLRLDEVQAYIPLIYMMNNVPGRSRMSGSRKRDRVLLDLALNNLWDTKIAYRSLGLPVLVYAIQSLRYAMVTTS